jgi:hypothetical protein
VELGSFIFSGCGLDRCSINGNRITQSYCKDNPLRIYRCLLMDWVGCLTTTLSLSSITHFMGMVDRNPHVEVFRNMVQLHMQ